MTAARYFQIDVFPATPGGGNPLGVVLDAADWSDARMQAFAAWTDLVETTFVLPPREPRAHYRVRIFTPTHEIPFAGHPTIGTAHVVIEAGVAAADGTTLVQECDAGLIPLRIEREGGARTLFLRAPDAQVVREGEEARTALAPLLRGLETGAVPPALVEGGRRWWLAEIDGVAALRAWQADHAAIATLARATQSLGLCLYARERDPRAAGHDLVVRAFPSGVGIAEDPASGAANGLVAAYLARCEPDGPLAHGYVVSQGREIGRDARIVVRYEDGAAWVGGRATTVVAGHAQWPPD